MPTSRAAVLTAPNTLTLQSRPLPEPGPGEVRLAIEQVGVCGTDLALYTGSYPAPLPLVPGHEAVGRVDAVGPGVDATVGQRVVPEINATCLAMKLPEPCEACRRGMPRHCQRRTVLGIIAHDGAFATHAVMPAGCLHPVPEDLPLDLAAFVEPVAAALQTFAMAGDPRGQKVLVVGPGRLGTLILAVAADLGAEVAAVGRSPRSLERALRFGAQQAFTAEDPALREWLGELGADIVVEVTGDPNGVDRALDWVRPRGTVAVKSTPGPRGTVDLTRLVVDEVRLVGSRCGDFAEALRWLSATRWPIAEIIEATYPLEQADDAFQAAFHRAKVMVRP